MCDRNGPCENARPVPILELSASAESTLIFVLAAVDDDVARNILIRRYAEWDADLLDATGIPRREGTTKEGYVQASIEVIRQGVADLRSRMIAHPSTEEEWPDLVGSEVEH